MTAEDRRARRARALATDTAPGKVLALALLANAPIAMAFVAAPLLSRGDTTAGRALVPYVLALTPLFVAASLYSYKRARPERRAHRAARIGLVLDGAAGLLWIVLAGLTLFGS